MINRLLYLTCFRNVAPKCMNSSWQPSVQDGFFLFTFPFLTLFLLPCYQEAAPSKPLPALPQWSEPTICKLIPWLAPLPSSIMVDQGWRRTRRRVLVKTFLQIQLAIHCQRNFSTMLPCSSANKRKALSMSGGYTMMEVRLTTKTRLEQFSYPFFFFF